ncbi:fimbrial protein [Kalamiella sp. sgz302252]|uniref:fimbrial protein n=1 Tax=Pantoea sp. sgz302252 TaxID=3341827 RepID=UPI0036D38C0C
MPRISTVLLASLLLTGTAYACSPDPESSPPQTLTIASQTIPISADAASDTSVPVAVYDSPSAVQTEYINCVFGTNYGRAVIGLGSQDTATKIYPTQIPGLGVKILFNNTKLLKDFPATETILFNPSEGNNPDKLSRLQFLAGAHFRLEFYKTAEKLSLSKVNNNPVLPAGELAYLWVNSPDLANYALKLVTGGFTIASTPACTTDSAKTIDFGTVTPALLRDGGVERTLDFALSCQTDYASWSATASMTTPTPSADASYIRVSDAANNTDALGIEIYNSAGDLIKVDGSSTEQSAARANNASMQFNWKAKLINAASAAARPQNGAFMARAEIILQIE